ncbi:MAG TPA: LysM domain-containing protein [Acidimicrobiia bacterium]|nr:LysM domain-containing protein [Acidimicrobiia bacterium]
MLHRRRVLAAVLGLGMALTAARAGAALGGHTLAASGRLPHVRTVVVQPGDTVWSIAHRLEPARDPRGVVDVIVKARGTSAVYPGETIAWLED